MLHVRDLIIGEVINDLYFVIWEVIDDFPQPRFVCEVFDLFDFDIGKVVHNFDFYIWEIVNELNFPKELTFIGDAFRDCLLAQ